MGKHRHTFFFNLKLGDGSVGEVKAKALVSRARKALSIVLTEDHVQRALARHGQGTTTHCAGALCAYDHRIDFAAAGVPSIGHMDWQRSRVFVATHKRADGLPAKCVAYEHNSKVAHLFDTKAGLEKLLRRLQREGAITINLYPYRKRSDKGRPGAGRPSTGARARSKGAKLRYATVHPSYVPETCAG
jgi:hypothetical protein